MTDYYKIKYDDYLRQNYSGNYDYIKNFAYNNFYIIRIEHKESVLQAIANYMLTTKDYNELHGADYGFWNTEKFNKNFPGMKGAAEQN